MGNRIFEKEGRYVVFFGKYRFASDKFDHFSFMGIGVSGIIMGFFMQVMWYIYPESSIFWMKVIGVLIGAVVATGLGIFIEFWQKWKGTGMFEWKDVYAQMYGEVIPALMFIILSTPYN